MPRIKQNILPNTQERYIHAHHFTVNRIDELIAMIPSATNVLGFALQLSSEGRVDAIAFSTLDEAFYVVLQRSFQSETALGSTAYQANRKGDAAPRSPPSPNLVFEVTEHLGAVLAGFSMARLALHIYRDKGWPMRGIDLSSLSRSQEERPLSPAEFLEKKVSASVKRRGADVLWYPDDSEDDEEIANRVCLRAWLSAVCANADLLALRGASYVDTRLESLNSQQLHCLGEMILCAELLEAQRPSRFENDFDSIKDDGDGLTVTNARFKNRIRASAQTIVVLGRADGTEIRSQVKGASGKRTMLRVIEGQSRGGFTRATVHGREELTTAENARDSFALRVMQGFILPQDRRFINLIWFPSQTRMPARNGGPSESWEFEKLNDSQRQVASAMLSTSEPLVIVHGPPGTGKTSTIAAAADCWIQQAQPVWIIAQSNVGVKNIARSFISKNITGFKLLVSKEFHFEWHEHLYEDIQSQFIRTDDLSQLKDVYETERFLGTTSIILCTLSTLSNPVLTKCGMFKLRPANVVVVDEASQINVFEYMHLFHRFKDLEKVCFFGDPKQLPPFGQDAVPQLQSIFDVKHLKPQAYFLNTQYRMPVPLGNFISHAVYNSELKSNHAIQDTSCIAFIDAAKGQEVQSGKSWTNTEEARLVVNLVRDYYRHTNHCVITPYDAQRAEIVKALEAADLPSDQVYNVDSFQGHEADFVIVSPTRTARPGFLSVQSRTNVMLTRCKKGMVLVTNKFFVTHHADRTLLGKLATYWAKLADGAWIDWRRVLERSVDLPGAPGLRTLPRDLPAPSPTQRMPSWRTSAAQRTADKQSLSICSTTSSIQTPPQDVTQSLQTGMSHLHLGTADGSSSQSWRATPRVNNQFSEIPADLPWRKARSVGRLAQGFEPTKRL